MQMTMAYKGPKGPTVKLQLILPHIGSRSVHLCIGVSDDDTLKDRQSTRTTEWLTTEWCSGSEAIAGKQARLNP